MNDFTKEELHTLLDLFHWAADSPSWRNTEGWDDVLQSKIKSMIDNYCEHEFIFTLYDSKVHCHKCKRGLNDNQ